jgi:hypothetical protein
MYKCQVTGKYSRQGNQLAHPPVAGEKLNKIVVATRERTYTKWVKNEDTLKWEEVFVAKGWEIVREINASDEGVRIWEGWSPEQREAHLKYLDAR